MSSPVASRSSSSWKLCQLCSWVQVWSPPPTLATTILFLHQFVVRPDRYWGKFPNCRRQLPSSAPGHNAQYRTLDHRVQTSSWRPPNLPWTPGKLQAGNSLDVLRVDLQKTVFIISINGHRIALIKIPISNQVQRQQKQLTEPTRI